MNISRPGPRSLDTSSRRLKSPSSGVTLWRPDVVLADTAGAPPRRRIMPGEPALRPDAVRAQVDAAHSLLRSLSDARATLGTQATRTDVRGQGPGSERERVSAAMETYRVKAALDEVLGTLREVAALMEGRSLR